MPLTTSNAAAVFCATPGALSPPTTTILYLPLEVLTRPQAANAVSKGISGPVVQLWSDVLYILVWLRVCSPPKRKTYSPAETWAGVLNGTLLGLELDIG